MADPEAPASVPEVAVPKVEEAQDPAARRYLVLDASGILHGFRLLDWAPDLHFVTTQDVFNELKDARTRKFLADLPFDIEIMEPSREAVAAVAEFANKTGDIHVLSRNDMRLIALEYTLEKQIHGIEHIRSTPANMVDRAKIQEFAARSRAAADAEAEKASKPAPQKQQKPAQAKAAKTITIAPALSAPKKEDESVNIFLQGLSVSSKSSAPAASASSAPKSDSSGRFDDVSDEEDGEEAFGGDESLDVDFAAEEKERLRKEKEAEAELSKYIRKSKEEIAQEKAEMAAKARSSGKEEEVEIVYPEGHIDYKNQKVPTAQDFPSLASDSSSSSSAPAAPAFTPAPAFSWAAKAREVASKPAPHATFSSIITFHTLDASGSSSLPAFNPSSASGAIAPPSHFTGSFQLEEAEDLEGEDDEHDDEEGEADNDDARSVFSMTPSVAASTTTGKVDKVVNFDFAPGGWDDEDDAGAWITPENVQEVSKKIISRKAGAECAAEGDQQVKVGIVTADFAMQNVILQMNLSLISVDGMRIKRLRQYIKRCHACYEIVFDMTRRFCPKCGNYDTLIRLPVWVNEEGKMNIAPVFTRRNFRGKNAAIPPPKGGRNFDPITVEDATWEWRMRQTLGHRKMELNRKGKVIANSSGVVDAFAPEFIITNVFAGISDAQLGNKKTHMNKGDVLGYKQRKPISKGHR